MAVWVKQSFDSTYSIRSIDPTLSPELEEPLVVHAIDVVSVKF